MLPNRYFYGVLLLLLVLIIAVIIAKSPNRTATITKETSTESSVESLNSEIRERKERRDRVSNWNRFFLIFAALAASGLVVADVLLDEAGRLLSGTQDELGSLRDAKAREDSDNKELKIADANRLAGEANRRAEELAQENLRLKRAIDRSVAETLLREEELKAKNLATESKLEEELKTRLELEKSLTPRELPIILEGPKANFDSLRPFAEMQVIFDV